MRCLVCENLSWKLLCKRCQERLLRPNLRRRKLLGDFEVISFYSYSEIEELITTKHHIIGHQIFSILAKNSLRLFAREFFQSAFVIPVDDKISKAGYSHTAILAYAMKTKYLCPKYASLFARNSVNYSGKSLDFRLKNPRNFHYSGPAGDIIIVDDVVTTGLTLKEAYSVTKSAGANPLFALTLADARD